MEYVQVPEPKNKTLDVQLDVTQEDLATKVKKSFDFAKSAGYELDVTFSYFGLNSSAI